MLTLCVNCENYNRNEGFLSQVRVDRSLVFCVMVGRLLVGFVSLNLVFWVMVGRLLVGFVWLNL